MKTIAEIKTEMTDAILANEVLVDAMNLDTNKTWAEQTSEAGVLNVLLYIVAVSWYALQWMMEQFKQDVEQRILAALPGTASWYWNRALAFQYGDAINSDGGYDVIDASKQLVKYCAVVDAYQGVLVKVNGAEHSKFESGSNELTAFNTYINAVKFAGCRVTVSSLLPDEMRLTLKVKVDPLVINSNMRTIETNLPVIQTAVEAFLAAIPYNGLFNKSKLADAIQAVNGVEDVVIVTVSIKDETINNFALMSRQNYTAVSGSIVLDNITYQNYNE